MKKEILFTIFKSWKSDIWKIRQLNLKYEDFSIHFFMYISIYAIILKFCFNINMRPMPTTIEYQTKFFI